jgi:hypothetical protein
MSRNNRIDVRLPSNKCLKEGCKRNTRDASGYCHDHTEQRYAASTSLQHVPAPTLGSVAKDGKEFYEGSKEFIDIVPVAASLSAQGPVGIAAAGVIGAAMMTSATEKGLTLAQGVLDGSDPSNKVERVLHTDLGTGFVQRLKQALTGTPPYPASAAERTVILRCQDELKETLARKNASDLYRDLNKVLTRMAKPSKVDPLTRIENRIKSAEGIIDSPTHSQEHKRQQRVERSILIKLSQDLMRTRTSGS